MALPISWLPRSEPPMGETATPVIGPGCVGLSHRRSIVAPFTKRPGGAVITPSPAQDGLSPMQGKPMSAAERDAAISSVADLLGMTPQAVRRAVAGMPDNAEMHQLRSEIARAKATATAAAPAWVEVLEDAAHELAG